MSASGRTGVYDVTVRDSAGKTALFRGKSYRISGEVIAGLAAARRQPSPNNTERRQA
jgi:acyl-CoA thioesterase